ncbi:MAG: tRNA (adenosine(37)-N6)-threonylcarbamoyltransferase complex ATPase subunit type 1 TsaE [Micavibrio aeruginosavorus]|uniref:tRNA threonylcarbamoyladenosine biosynthesis protein TsaE n=1 Tax=Micavibrio aeruginosavorus TaxID=349221 RepID=A0A7T5UGU4_9BACT|nr:MAG: tRNA (adenosine(37)-N6)-threonylcarbamoyltransferase complex ATPase subunit type 1 TsaE [Micavibrio aeruginosavorus]
MKWTSHSEAETARLAARMATNLMPGDMLCLHGALGVGKSVFARALIRALAGNPALEVPSPTFTLVQTYDTAKGPLWHFDLYRLQAPEEIYELGWEDAMAEAIILIEWPQRIQSLLPPERLDIHLSETSGGGRLLQLDLIGSKKDMSL